MVGAIKAPSFALVWRRKNHRFRSFGARKTIVCDRFALEKTSFSSVLRAKNLVCARKPPVAPGLRAFGARKNLAAPHPSPLGGGWPFQGGVRATPTPGHKPGQRGPKRRRKAEGGRRKAEGGSLLFILPGGLKAHDDLSPKSCVAGAYRQIRTELKKLLRYKTRSNK
jgi:hypothetical protein